MFSPSKVFRYMVPSYPAWNIPLNTTVLYKYPTSLLNSSMDGHAQSEGEETCHSHYHQIKEPQGRYAENRREREDSHNYHIFVS